MIVASSKARSSSVHVLVTRADGSVKDLGLVSYWHRNPLKRWAVNLYIKLRELFR